MGAVMNTNINCYIDGKPMIVGNVEFNASQADMPERPINNPILT
jgi:hypothetical protein